MKFRSISSFLCAIVVSAASLSAQENPAKRLSSIVSVAVEEYAKAFDDHGRIVAPAEYQETTDFLKDAADIARRFKAYNADQTRAVLDTLIGAVLRKASPEEVRMIHVRFKIALGHAGAMDLPTGPMDTARGRELYQKNCVACHGEKGMGDGPNARALKMAVPAIGSRTATPDLNSALAYNVVSVGVRATPMPAFGGALTPQDRWNVVNYVYAMRGEKMQPPAATADATQLEAGAAATTIMSLLDSAMEFARAGKTAEAGDRAFDAYIAFEPLETPVRAKKPSLVTTMERYFADFKAALRKHDLDAARESRNAIESGLPEVVDLTRKPTGGWSTFLQSLLIILREGFEAILVIGAVVAFLIKMGHRERLRSIWWGVVWGILASFATAVVLQTVFAYVPASREIVEGSTMLLAVIVLFSVSYWLISKVEAAKWQQFIREKVTSSLEHGGGKALALVAFLAVYREGAETALFYQALFNEGNVAVPLSLGIVAGMAGLAVIFTLFYRFGVRIPMRPFFTVTSVLLYYMAFVFMGKGIRELQEGNVIPITLLHGLPNVPTMGIFPSMETLAGQLLLLALFVFAVAKSFSGRLRVDSRRAGADVPPVVHPERAGDSESKRD